MELEPDDRNVWYRRPIVWGWLGTVVVALIGGLSALLPACSVDFSGNVNCVPKGTYLWSAPPNELGDTLAGFAGALAFIWIIVTVAMQSQELAAQREELKLTRNEFERMAVSQEQQVKILVKQGEIFEDEQRQRRENDAAELLEAQIESCLSLLEDSGPSWEYLQTNKIGGSTKGRVPISHEFAPNTSHQRSFEFAAYDILRNSQEISSFVQNSEITSFPSNDGYVDAVILKLEEIRLTMNSASKAKTIWLEELNLELVLKELHALQHPKYWKQNDA